MNLQNSTGATHKESYSKEEGTQDVEIEKLDEDEAVRLIRIEKKWFCAVGHLRITEKYDTRAGAIEDMLNITYTKIAAIAGYIAEAAIAERESRQKTDKS